MPTASLFGSIASPKMLAPFLMLGGSLGLILENFSWMFEVPPGLIPGREVGAGVQASLASQPLNRLLGVAYHKARTGQVRPLKEALPMVAHKARTGQVRPVKEALPMVAPQGNPRFPVARIP